MSLYHTLHAESSLAPNVPNNGQLNDAKTTAGLPAPFSKLERSDFKVTQVLSVFTKALDKLNTDISTIANKRKTHNALNQAIKSIHASLAQDLKESAACNGIFARYRAGSTRASLENIVVAAEQQALISKAKTAMTEAEIVRANGWLSNLYQGYASHEGYLKKKGRDEIARRADKEMSLDLGAEHMGSALGDEDTESDYQDEVARVQEQANKGMDPALEDEDTESGQSQYTDSDDQRRYR